MHETYIMDQSSYVEGRKILVDIIIAHEFIHSLNSSIKLGMLLKLDMLKAFDKLSWQYIEQVLLAFGFGHRWIQWTLALTSSPFFSILINGVPSSTFKPSCGIHQGDSLYPFFFILMVEGLSCHTHATFLSGKIQGLYLHIPYLQHTHE